MALRPAPVTSAAMFAFLFVCMSAISALPVSEEIPIWSGLAPGTEKRPNEEFVAKERIQKVYQPSLTIHLPPRELATGSACLILPGGGYHHLAIFKEGHHTAAWLNTLGIAGFVLKYRLDREEALQDTLQAIRFIRENAAQYGVDPRRLGLIGFSAGGHLLLNAVSHSAPETRPDFLIVMYPVVEAIDLSEAFASRAAPTIIFGASDDATAPPTNAISVYQSLAAADVDVELHLYRTGGHGFGLGLHRGPVVDWTERCEVWLEAQGYLDPVR